MTKRMMLGFGVMWSGLAGQDSARGLWNVGGGVGGIVDFFYDEWKVLSHHTRSRTRTCTRVRTRARIRTRVHTHIRADTNMGRARA